MAAYAAAWKNTPTETDDTADGTGSGALHPLLAWWTVLHALSNLARYQPVRWSEHIAVDTSKVAVAIEVLLDEAVTVVPDLIRHAIREVG
ncbi:YaaC family protein [Kitasatospora sp. NPDC058060]|uniref:YaaC family protein n=1 Tax=Kitasatospora sp. NPDC058060 TaxID=3346318 RepID=UPI0036EDB41E